MELVKIVAISYIFVVFVSIMIVVITRIVYLIRLANRKGGKILDKNTEGQIINFLASLMLPVKLKYETEILSIKRDIKVLNQLKNIYWYLMMGVLTFIITMNVFEHGFDIKLL